MRLGRADVSCRLNSLVATAMLRHATSVWTQDIREINERPGMPESELVLYIADAVNGALRSTCGSARRTNLFKWSITWLRTGRFVAPACLSLCHMFIAPNRRRGSLRHGGDNSKCTKLSRIYTTRCIRSQVLQYFRLLSQPYASSLLTDQRLGKSHWVLMSLASQLVRDPGHLVGPSGEGCSLPSFKSGWTARASRLLSIVNSPHVKGSKANRFYLEQILYMPWEEVGLDRMPRSSVGIRFHATSFTSISRTLI